MRDLPVESTLHFNSAFRTPHSAFDLPPLANPLVVQDGDDASLLQHLDARGVAVGLPVEGVRHTRIDDQLREHPAGGGAHEHDLVAHAPGGLHERIHLRMNAAAAPRYRRIALVGHTASVPVVTDRQHVLEHLVRHDGPDPQPGVGGALRDLHELLPELLILEHATLALPAAGLPARYPLAHPLDEVL